jgi:hypothetical protein
MKKQMTTIARTFAARGWKPISINLTGYELFESL